MKIAIFGNSYAVGEREAFIKILEVLERYRIDVAIEQEFFLFLQDLLGLSLNEQEVISPDGDIKADFIFSIGGDGTLLRVVERARETSIPIMGINLGRLGFLADCAVEEFESMVLDLMGGFYHIEERTLLEMYSSDDSFEDYPLALNEIAILKQDTSSMITIHCWIDGEYINAYQADGLLVSTPTGSTAYSMSVGGPILMPQSPVLLLSPIASHSLNVRPLVIPDNSVIHLRVEGRGRHFLASLDGRSEVLDLSVELRISKSKKKVRLVKRESQTFYTTLKNKLMWGADFRIKPPRQLS
ncbi:MAG: NAD kinase [Bacteroidales bacterium]